MRAMSKECFYAQAICGGRDRLLRSDAPPAVIVASVCRFLSPSISWCMHCNYHEASDTLRESWIESNAYVCAYFPGKLGAQDCVLVLISGRRVCDMSVPPRNRLM